MRTTTYTLTLSVLLLLFAAERSAASSEYLYELWQLEDGLPQISVWSVVQDARGYLWIATEEGIARFDGKEFKSFTSSNTPELPANVTEALLPDGDGLWIGTRGGLVRLLHDRFTPYTTADGLVHDEVHVLLRDGRGGLWIGTTGGLSRFDGTAFTSLTARDGLPDDHVEALTEDRQGHLWIGTAGGLARKDGDELTVVGGLLHPSVQALYTDHLGRLWVGTYGGLQVLGDEGFHVPDEVASLTGVPVDLVTEDREGNLWIGTKDGLYRLAEGELTFQAPEKDALNCYILSLWEDHEGSLWIGSRYRGLIRLRKGLFENFGTPEGLVHNLVWSIYEDRAGNVWIGTNGGLDRLSPGGEITHFGVAEGLPSADLLALEEDRGGALWVGTFGRGLVRILDGKVSRITEDDGFPRVVSRDFLEERDGTFWIATNRGLLRRRDGRFEAFHAGDGLPDEDVRALHEDASGTLWILTQGGLARWAPSGSPPIRAVPGPFPDRLKSFLVEPDGTIWIGTWDDGLVRYRDGEVARFTVADGLYDRRIHSILDDGRGWLWMLTNQGVFRVRKTELEDFASGRVGSINSVAYTESDGMRSREGAGSVHPSGIRTRDGRFWFPTIAGVAIVDPAAVEELSGAPPVVLQEVLADGEKIDLYAREGVKLRPRTRQLNFRYTALSFARTESVRFRYRLAGYDDAWVETGSERTVQYTHLRPGKYRFEVRARGADGTWSPAEAFELELLPALYQRPAFYVLIAFALATLGWGVHRLQVRSLVRYNRELLRMKSAVEAKNREVEAKNDELERFTYTVSHDLKSPIFTIEGFLGLLTKDLAAGSGERVETDVVRIRDAVAKIRALLDDLLELSRIGRVVNPSEEVDLAELARESVELLAGPIEERQVEVVIAPELPTVFGDRPRLGEVVQNLIENAVKYMQGQADPRVEVDGWQEAGEAFLRVRDNGLGIEEAFHEKVFGLFNQLEPESEGTGIGLALAKRIVEFHGGRIWVESDGLGLGSSFYVALPALPAKG